MAAPLSGLLTAALSDGGLRAVLDASAGVELRVAPTPAVEVEGPAALRPFLAAGLSGAGTVLAVTATDREAEELAVAARELVDGEVVRAVGLHESAVRAVGPHDSADRAVRRGRGRAPAPAAAARRPRRWPVTGRVR